MDLRGKNRTSNKTTHLDSSLKPNGADVTIIDQMS
jgi:hypothetical protein